MEWNGPVEWTRGMDSWNGLVTILKKTVINGSIQSLDWTGGLDWWTGPVDWTGGLTFEAFCATY